MTKNMVGKWKGIVFLTQSVSKLSRNRLEKEKNELKITWQNSDHETIYQLTNHFSLVFSIFLFDGSRVNSEFKEHDLIYFILCSQYQQVERTVSPEGNRKKTSPVF